MTSFPTALTYTCSYPEASSIRRMRCSERGLHPQPRGIFSSAALRGNASPVSRLVIIVFSRIFWRGRERKGWREGVVLDSEGYSVILTKTWDSSDKHLTDTEAKLSNLFYYSIACPILPSTCTRQYTTHQHTGNLMAL